MCDDCREMLTAYTITTDRNEKLNATAQNWRTLATNQTDTIAYVLAHIEQDPTLNGLIKSCRRAIDSYYDALKRDSSICVNSLRQAGM